MNLFTPYRLRGIELKNRIVVSPMCQYSAKDGHPTNWHLVHLGSRAVGGAALVITEATGVNASGRISPGDTGIYLDSHVEAWRPIVEFMREQGAVAGIQLAHAGRKGSTPAAWLGEGAIAVKDGGWEPVAPSAEPFNSVYPMPKALTAGEIDQIVVDFVAAARRALQAGFQVVEIHGAHGYLLHEFYSPLSNHRTDEYGGSLRNRLRFPLEVISDVRNIWPGNRPLAVRISATDYFQGGWDIDEAIQYAVEIKKLGVDMIDVSGGGLVPEQKISPGLGYQVPYSEKIRKEAKIPTIAVGMIHDPHQAEEIIATGKADLIAMARGMLYDPRWPWHAAEELKSKGEYPPQYLRCEPSKWPQAFPKNK